MDDTTLKGRTVVVTGAESGIGRAIAFAWPVPGPGWGPPLLAT